MLEYLTLLKQARKEWTEGLWCANHFAEDVDHNRCSVLSEEARYWCVQGYMARMVGIEARAFASHPLCGYLNAQAWPGIGYVNNGDGWAATVAVLEACIADLERQGEDAGG